MSIRKLARSLGELVAEATEFIRGGRPLGEFVRHALERFDLAVSREGLAPDPADLEGEEQELLDALRAAEDAEAAHTAELERRGPTAAVLLKFTGKVLVLVVLFGAEFAALVLGNFDYVGIDPIAGVTGKPLALLVAVSVGAMLTLMMFWLARIGTDSSVDLVRRLAAGGSLLLVAVWAAQLRSQVPASFLFLTVSVLLPPLIAALFEERLGIHRSDIQELLDFWKERRRLRTVRAVIATCRRQRRAVCRALKRVRARMAKQERIDEQSALQRSVLEREAELAYSIALRSLRPAPQVPPVKDVASIRARHGRRRPHRPTNGLWLLRLRRRQAEGDSESPGNTAAGGTA